MNWKKATREHKSQQTWVQPLPEIMEEEKEELLQVKIGKQQWDLKEKEEVRERKEKEEKLQDDWTTKPRQNRQKQEKETEEEGNILAMEKAEKQQQRQEVKKKQRSKCWKINDGRSSEN